MDAVWYGIANFFQFLFKLIKPIGMSIDMIFLLIGFVGAIYWLWYTVYVKKGGHNYLSDPDK
jgi:hypothetical protein